MCPEDIVVVDIDVDVVWKPSVDSLLAEDQKNDSILPNHVFDGVIESHFYVDHWHFSDRNTNDTMVDELYVDANRNWPYAKWEIERH